ncbi:heat shock protein HslJ [Mesorhizobium sp. J18]|uniref:META domain-containing protein n=1 Tax=Mesorhizobium sp. J18 TaxID=935263 RepID=UPI00119B0635|nr:META domain-containing protein [Mesorhizobium sp. J18]TWG98506.1 heat shock protein HslJ [Mesorhizobium sp. J18]
MVARAFTLLLSFALTAGIAAIASIGPAYAQETMISISGSLTYRQKIALSDNSVAVVEIRDAAQAAGAEAIAEQRIALEGRQVPVDFKLETNRSGFKQGTDYVLRGVILNGAVATWLTDPVPIDPSKAEIDVGMLMLKQSSEPVPFGAEEAVTRLQDIQGTEWIVEEIGGGEIVDNSRVTLNFGIDGSLSGRASCNTYRASYTAVGQKLEIGDAVATMMACAPVLMEQERKFLDILAAVKSFQLDDSGALVLDTEEHGGTLVARSE